MKILLTGYSGFLGKNLLKTLSKKYETINLLGRREAQGNYFNIEDSNSKKIAFDDVDIVIHCAGQAHVMNADAASAKLQYQKSNFLLTKDLVKLSIANNVKRFIFISSIKVNGESTAGTPFTPFDKPNPSDSYAKSKLDAEKAIIEMTQNEDMDFVIIRPPLIYGEGVKGNIQLLSKLVSSRIPIPLKGINNKRSMVNIKNLIDLILVCTRHPRAANEIFLVSDNHDISTSEMIKLLGRSQGIKPVIFYISKKILSFISKLAGKYFIVRRLTESLEVDISHTINTLEWSPPHTVNNGFNDFINGSD